MNYTFKEMARDLALMQQNLRNGAQIEASKAVIVAILERMKNEGMARTG